MSNSQDAIKRVIEAFERSGWSEIDVRSGAVRVHLSSAATTGSPLVATLRAHPDAEPPATAPSGTEAPESAALPGPLIEPPPDGAHVVVAPSPGILWRSPEPGFPPFVDVGLTVEASATVCIIEVMKLMNHLKAGVSGEVVAVYGENGVAVQKGQALFAIAPSGSSS